MYFYVFVQFIIFCGQLTTIFIFSQQRPHSLDSFSFGAKILERENIDMLQGESLPTRLFITGDTWHFHPQWPYLEACFSVYLSCFSVLYSFFVWFFALLSSIVFCCTVALLLLKKRGILTCLGLQNLLWFELCFCCFHMTKKLFSFP